MNQVSALFASIPVRDPLSLFHDGRPDGEQITSFLGLRAKDVARAARVSLHSVRYDLRMPSTLEQWLQDVATTVNLVAEFFGDEHKTRLWFSTPNPQLGGIPPVDMIRLGRVRKLLTFVQTALDQNKR